MSRLLGIHEAANALCDVSEPRESSVYQPRVSSVHHAYWAQGAMAQKWEGVSMNLLAMHIKQEVKQQQYI